MDNEVVACYECGDIAVEKRNLICHCRKVSLEHAYCKDHNSLDKLNICHCKNCCAGLLSYTGVYQNGKLHKWSELDSLDAGDKEKEHISKQLYLGNERTHAGNDSTGRLLLLRSSWSGKAKRGSNKNTSCDKKRYSATDNPIYNPWSSFFKTQFKSKESKELDNVKHKDSAPNKAVLSQSLQVTISPTECPTRSSERLAGKIFNSMGKFEWSSSEEKFVLDDFEDKSELYDLTRLESFPANNPDTKAMWKGSFEIFGVENSRKRYGSFVAHPPVHPRMIDNRAELFANEMPEVLNFMVLRRAEIWGEIFSSEFAFDRDISLYFFPKNVERSVVKYACLITLMEENDFALRSCVNGVELHIFVSKQLHHSEDWVSFLWGIFRVANKEQLKTPEIEMIYDDAEASPSSDQSSDTGTDSDDTLSDSIEVDVSSDSEDDTASS